MNTNLLPQICKTCLGKGFVVIPICDCDGVKYEKHRCLDCASVCENPSRSEKK